MPDDLLLFSMLAELEEGKPIDFIRTGVWTDRNGNEVEVTEGFIDALEENFEAGSAGQEIPVDIRHERGEAAGWLKRLFRSDQVGQAVIEWNPLGRQLVSDKVYRYVSASINRTTHTLASISLTNFPAVKGLAPIELEAEQGTQLLFADSLERRLDHVRHAFSEILGGNVDAGPWPRLIETQDQYVIAQVGSAAVPSSARYYRVPYAIQNGDVFFAAASQWRSVEPGDWVQSVAEQPVEEASQAEPEPEPVPIEAAEQESTTEQEPTASLSLRSDAMSDNQTQPEPDVSGTPAPQPKPVNLETLSEADRAELFRDLTDHFEQSKSDLFTNLMAQWRLEHEIAELAADVTHGQHALPATQQEIIALLTNPTREGVQALLSAIRQGGLVDLSEHGRSDSEDTPKQLTPDQKIGLAGHLRRVGNTAEQVSLFFEANDIGDPAQYDLTAFELK